MRQCSVLNGARRVGGVSRSGVVVGGMLLLAALMVFSTARAARAEHDDKHADRHDDKHDDKEDEAHEAEESEHRVEPFRLKGLDGRLFDSEERLAGRVHVVSYWRSGQRQSVRCLEGLVQLHREYAGQDVGFVTFVSGDVDRAEVEKLATELELPFPVLIDPDRKLYGELHTVVSPTSWFYDLEGIRRFKYPGCRRDFVVAARADLDLLLGKIDEQERAKRVEHKAAPPTRGLVGAPVRYRLAKRLLARGKREAARQELTRAWQAEKPLAAAGVELGLMLLEDGSNEEARKILERAVEMAPQDARALGAKGLALMRMGEVDEGGELLERALESEVGEPVLYYEMGRLSEERGSMPEAAGYYRKGLELVVKPPAPAK